MVKQNSSQTVFHVPFSFLFGCLLVVFVWFSPKSALAAVGISPGSIEVGSILSGTIVSKSVIISRTESDVDTRVIVQVSGPHKDAILGASEILLPKGVQEVPYHFVISSSGLPKDEDLFATLTFLFLPDHPNASGTSIVLSLSGKVHFQVTDSRIENIEMKQLNFKSTNNGELELYYFIQNTGNVETKPDELTITLTNRDSLKIAQIITIRDREIPIAPAHSEQNIVFNLEHQLSSGLYYVDAEVKQGGRVIFHSDKTTLQVFGKKSVVLELLSEPSFQVPFFVFVMGIGSIVFLNRFSKRSL